MPDQYKPPQVQIASGQVDWLELQAKLEQTFEPDPGNAA